MWFKRDNGVESSTKDLQLVSQAVAQSFVHVRRDVQNLYDWMRHIHAAHETAKRDLSEHRMLVESQRQEIAKLRQVVDEIPKSKHEIRALIDEYYRVEALLDRIQKIESHVERLNSKANEPKVESFVVPQHAPQPVQHAPHPSDEMLRRLAEIQERSQQMMVEKLAEISGRIDDKKSTPQSALKEKIMSRVARNSKEYVKTMIRQMIDKYGRASGLQLREIIVDEQGLSSKSSFYRLLAEIEEQGEVGVVREGKEKVYFAKSGVKKTEDWVPDGQ